MESRLQAATASEARRETLLVRGLHTFIKYEIT